MAAGLVVVNVFNNWMVTNLVTKFIGAKLCVNVFAVTVLVTDTNVDADDATDSTDATFSTAATFASAASLLVLLHLLHLLLFLLLLYLII